MMNLKKTALASAITLALAGGPTFAATTSVKGAFILDRTTVETGGIVNLALLALNDKEEVDLYGEKGGAVIIAVVTSEIGTVMGGSTNPGEQPGDPVAGGDFAADLSYVKLVQGRGRVHVYYPPETSPGKDKIEVILQERTANPEGGVNFKDIAKTTKTIDVQQSGADDPLSLDIVGFKAASADAMGMTDCHDQSRDADPSRGGNEICEAGNYGPDDGISGAMTAGIQGGQIIVEAGNPYARGDVTVTLRKTNNPTNTMNKVLRGDECIKDNGCYEYTYPAEMQRGIAIVTLDNQVTKAGTYYIEATFDGFEGDSVDMFYADTLKVHSTGIPKGIALSSNKNTVAKPGDTFDFATASNTMGVGQGTKITGYLLDEYGNMTSNGTKSELRIAVQDAQGVFSNTALSLKVPADSKGMMATTEASGNQPTTDSIVGNAKDEIQKVGTTSLVAVAVDNQNEPIGSIAPSKPLAIKVVADSLKVGPVLTASQLAGTEFNAFTIHVTDGTGKVKVDNENKPVDPGPIVIKTRSEETITVNRKNESPYHVQALFRKATPYGSYLVGDKAGNYGQVEVWVDSGNPMVGGILPAAATVVELQNAHGVAQTRVDPEPLTLDKKYVTKLPESAFKMFDDYGNAITGAQPLSEDDTGTFTVTSSNGTVAYTTPELNRGIPGRKNGMSTYNATITFDTKETPAFAGEDSIQVNFTKPGLGARSLTIKSVVPAVKELDSIKLYIEQTTLPVNSAVAMTVEVLDQNGDMLVAENSQVKVPLTLQINGQDGDTVTPTITDHATGKRINSGQSVDLATGRKVFVIGAGANEGQFSLTFADAGDPTGLKETKTFTVQRHVEPPPPEKTEPECLAEGNLWDSTAASGEECKVLLPLTANGESFVMASDGTISTSDVNITGGMSVDGGALGNNITASLADESEIRFVGVVQFDSADAGKDVDIVAIADYQLSPLAAGAAGGGVFSLLEGGNVELFTTVVDLPAFYADPHTVVEGEPKVVEIYTGPFVQPPFAPSNIRVTFGYRLEDGTIHFNPAPLNIDLLP
jgi:hypothetical protein